MTGFTIVSPCYPPRVSTNRAKRMMATGRASGRNKNAKQTNQTKKMESKLHGRGTAHCTTCAPPTAYVKKEVGEPGVSAALCSLEGKRSTAQFRDWVLDVSPSSELVAQDDLSAVS